MPRDTTNCCWFKFGQSEGVFRDEDEGIITIILGNPVHPLYDELGRMGITFSHRLTHPLCIADTLSYHQPSDCTSAIPEENPALSRTHKEDS